MLARKITEENRCLFLLCFAIHQLAKDLRNYRKNNCFNDDDGR